MGLVSRPRALHIKNIQMSLPPGERERERERESARREERREKLRGEEERRDSRQNLRAARRDSANYVHETM